MHWSRLFKIKNHIPNRVEIDGGPVGKHELPGRCDDIDAAVGIDRFRRQTGEPEHDCLVGAVAFSGPGQRAEQGDFQALEADALALIQRRHERRGGLHRPMVCEDEGPIPILNRSKTLIIGGDRPSLAPIATFSSFAG
jgi:hypothetical protein